MSSFAPPLVVFLLPLTLTTAMVTVFILFILRRGWSGYRGLIGAAVVLVLAFGPIRVWLTGTLTTAWLLHRATSNIEAILWGGVVSGAVVILALASLIRRITTSVPSTRGI